MTFPSGKKIIALAVAGLVSGAAFAQTSVTLSGTVDVGYATGTDSWKTNAGKETNKYSNFRGGDSLGSSSSQLKMTVTEDMGNGLKAGYYHEIGLAQFANSDARNYNNVSSGVDQTVAAFNRTRQSLVYLESAKLGRVQIGYMNEIIDDVSGAFQTGSRNFVGLGYNAKISKTPASYAAGSVVDEAYTNGVKNSTIIGTDYGRVNAFQYTSPVFSGFQGFAQFGQGKVDSEDGIGDTSDNQATYRHWALVGKYSNGPLAAMLGYKKFTTDKSQVNSAIISTALAAADKDTYTSQAEWNAGVSYDFGVAKVTGMYFDRKANKDFENALNAAQNYDDTSKYRGVDVGVSVPLGQVTLFGTYTAAKQKLADNAATNLQYDYKVRGYQVGARYAFSKRTDVYGIYGRIKAEGSNDADGEEGKRSMFGMGLRHSF